MQINEIIKLCGVCLLPILMCGQLTAQEIRVNERGERIIVYPDGTWQYFSDFNRDQDNASGNTKPAEAGNKFPIFVGVISPLESPISVTEEDIFKIAIRRSQLAKDAVSLAETRAREATRARETIEKEFDTASRNPNASEEQLRQLPIRLNAAKKVENETQGELKRAQREATQAEQLTQKGNYMQEFKLNQRKKQELGKLEKQRNELASKPFESLLPMSDNTISANKETDLILHPPAPVCKIAYEGKDERTNEWRRDVQKQLLFTHTDERLRMFLKDKDYLRCEGFFTSLGGYRFLTLQFTFAYPNAREAYGFIEKGSILTIKLLDGNFINLKAGQMDRGSYDTEREILTYRVHYPLERGQLGLLKNSEVDTILVFWSTGYEEYEVYQLDFFMNQINCLEKS